MTVGGMLFNGVDTGAAPYGLILEKRRMALIPKTRDRAVAIPNRPGSHDFGTDLGERDIEIEGFIAQSTNAALEAAIPAIAQLFDPTNESGTDRGFKQLIFDTLSDRYFLAKLTGEPIVERMVTTGKVKLTMRCADPFAYSVAQYTPSAAASSLAITPGGTYRTFPVVEITAGVGYTGTVTLTNGLTAEAISWTGTLINGDILKFDMGTFRAYVNGVVSMAGLSTGSAWFPLYPNLAQTLTVTGLGTVSLLKAPYRYRWL